MIVVLSPAKSLDYTSPIRVRTATQPRMLEHSVPLIERLRGMQAPELAELMTISQNLAELNRDRFMDWHLPFDPRNARQAMLAFDGDVYEGLQARAMSSEDLKWAQQRVRILSGLYGVLRPLDLMQAYRLEMGTSLGVGSARNLYQYWGPRIGKLLQEDAIASKSKAVVNLASEEYFKAVDTRELDVPVIQPVFLDGKAPASGGAFQYKVISFFAKRARGLMARYAIEHRIKSPADLKAFDLEGYRFNPAGSDATRWVFQRVSPA